MDIRTKASHRPGMITRVSITLATITRALKALNATKSYKTVSKPPVNYMRTQANIPNDKPS